jgi:hypothetical protein
MGESLSRPPEDKNQETKRWEGDKNLDNETLIKECNAAFKNIMERVAEDYYLLPDSGSSLPTKVMVKRLKSRLKSLLKSLLKAPSKLDKIEEKNPYFPIIHRMIDAINAGILAVELALYTGKEEDRKEEDREEDRKRFNRERFEYIRKKALSIAVNWLGIYYATDESVVEEKIANSIIQINGRAIRKTWEQITAVFETLNETLNDFVTKNNLQEELPIQIVKDQNDGSFTIITSFLGQKICFRLPAPVFPEVPTDQQQTLPTN